MTFDDYRREAMRTAERKGDEAVSREMNLAIFALGLAGEAGEVADLIKKHVGHGHRLTKGQVEKELGDVLWYIAAVAQSCGLTIEEVAAANIAKLRARYPDGFSHAASNNRSE